MAISKVEIKNFTAFEDIAIDLSRGVNVFIGENGTGKTHLLKILYALCENSKWNQQVKKGRIGSAEFEIVDGRDLNYNFSRLFFQYDCIFRNSSNSSMIRLKDSKSLEEKSFFVSYPADKKLNVLHPSDIIYDIVFIPAKEMLSMAYILKINDRYSKEIKMDKTLIDIIKKSHHLKPDLIPELSNFIAPIIEKNIDGKVFVEEDDSFWIKKNDGLKIPFSMEAEGLRKLGLIWQLLMNESITKDSILLWDEPEANINPKLIPDVAEILLELSRNGVQVFIATHDYFLPNYFDVLRKETDEIMFHSLYKTEHGVQVESENAFDMLENNSINKELIRLYKEGVKKVMG